MGVGDRAEGGSCPSCKECLIFMSALGDSVLCLYLQWDPSALEDAQGMCAVCLVARVPFWGLLLFRLLPVSAAFFELLEGSSRDTPAAEASGLPTQVLVQLYEQLNTVNFHLMRYTEITFNLEAGMPPFIMTVKPGETQCFGGPHQGPSRGPLALLAASCV